MGMILQLALTLYATAQLLLLTTCISTLLQLLPLWLLLLLRLE